MTYRIGFAEREINPAIGMELVGYSPRQGGMICNGILDQLFVKTLIIDDGKNQSVVISYDLLGLDNDTTTGIKERVIEGTNLKNKDIMIAATHTHSGSSASSYVPPIWNKHPEYITKLLENTSEAFQEALRNKAYAKISFGLTNLNWNYYRIDDNRRVAPDQSVCVVRMDIMDNTIILFSYSCHPVILSTSKASSDYVGYARKTIEEANVARKTRTFSIFLNGCCGNINPYNPNSQEDLSEHTPEDAVTMGQNLGNAVNDVIPKTKDLQDKPIVNKLERVTELPKIINSKTTFHPVDIQLLEFSSVRLIGIPGEPFIETGNWVKDTFGKYTLPIGYANENVGYIPLAEYYNNVVNPKHGYHVYGAAKMVYGITIPANLEGDIRNKINYLLRD